MTSTTEFFRHDRSRSLQRLLYIRERFISVIRQLRTEDMVVQDPNHLDASPAKWHVQHALGWFWEQFVLREADPNYVSADPILFEMSNSYYLAVAEGDEPLWARNLRGSSRPTVLEVRQYVTTVLYRVRQLIQTADEQTWRNIDWLCEIGVQHAEQHFELLVNDLLVVFNQTPFITDYEHLRGYTLRDAIRPDGGAVLARRRYLSEPKTVMIGGGRQRFRWDNELPQHPYTLMPFDLSDVLTVNSEYLEFIQDGGYRNKLLWSSEGWNLVGEQSLTMPMHWEFRDGRYFHRGYSGRIDLPLNAPVAYVSLYEAEAYLSWRSANFSADRSARLPYEQELEYAVEEGHMQNFYKFVWQWTQSSHARYPGYQPLPGNLKEYTSKFFQNLYVLKGGSRLTPKEHPSRSYRNYWPAKTRIVLAGIRPAFDQ